MTTSKTKPARKSRKTKKVSAGDFLNLLDDQERSRGPMAFKPTARKRKLTPIQKEWVELALKISPRPVGDFLKSKRTQRWIAEAESQMDRIASRIHNFWGRQ